VTGATRRHPATHWMGLVLAAAGMLLIAINVFIAPFVTMRDAMEITAGSTLFAWRQSLAAVDVLLVTIGTVGIFLWQADRAPRAAIVVFLLSFTGSALLLAWEWINVFVIRSLALRVPDALRALEAEQGVTLWDLGAMVPLLLFVIGWVAVAVCVMVTSPRLRIAAALIPAGLILTPLLTPLLGLKIAGAIGNAVLGAGWIWLGWDMWRATAAEGNTAERRAFRGRR
jgi:hypothetical protein